MNELDKLKWLLDQKGIPYVSDKNHFFPNVVIFSKRGRRLCDAIIPPDSDGSFLEIAGALTLDEMIEEYPVLTGLTAEEVLERFKYCYKHSTKVYEHLDTIKK